MISIVIDSALAYPDADDFYSPDERFPEYPYVHISKQKNPVYQAVRNCFVQAGLDREHFGTSSWNPLSVLVQPGTRVFVLCNFVFHRLSNESAEDFLGKCIHGSVLRPLIDYLLLAVGEGGSVSFGNAAMQACQWESVLLETGAQAVMEFYRSIEAPVELKDLRLLVAEKNRLGAITKVERRPESNGVQINLGADSLMAELDRGSTTPYRVMNYNPTRTEAFHSRGSHSYVINRQILESDVIVHLAKLKTHEKVAITCALKGCVGAVGHKDSLPHYRFGPPEIGGDEFPSDRTGLFRKVSAFHGYVQKTRLDRPWGNLLRVMDRFIRRAPGLRAPISEGGWWGNDTAWRMVLDLSRILTYATSAGELQPVAMRKQFAFIDGVVGGEGNGPLSPTAVRSGLLLFSDNPLAADYVSAIMMNFDPNRIPMILEASRLAKYPLIDHPLVDERVIYNGSSVLLSDLPKLVSHRYKPPVGWNGRL
jgi:hypothetical protein